MNKINLICTSILIFIFYSISYTQELPDIIDWMPITQSVSGGAMGRTSVSNVCEGGIVFTNPGGIVFFDNNLKSAAYYQGHYSSDKDINYFSLYLKSKNNVKVCFNHERYDEKDNKKHYGYGMAMCKKISDIGIGINIKMLQFKDLPLRDKTYFYNATDKDVFTLDLGVLYYKNFKYKNLPAAENISGGMSISNIFGRVKIPSKKIIKLPSFLRAGYSFSAKSLKQKNGLSIISFTNSFEWAKTINDAYYSSTGVGFEMGLYEIVFGRLGYYRRNSIIKGSTSGFGISLPFNRFFRKLPVILKYNYGRYLYEYYPYENINTHSVNIVYNADK